MADERLALPDGTRISYLDVGAADGDVVLYLHGTPSSRLQAGGPVAAVAADLGLRLVAPDRPGCGDSTFFRYSVNDYARLTARFADALAIGRFGVLGTSGGGRYAAACAAVLGDRVRRVALVASTAPADLPGARQTRSREDAFAYALAVRAPWLFRAWMAVFARKLRRRPDAWRTALPPLCAADQRVLQRPAAQAALRSALGEAFRHGARGVAHDYRLEALPWGVELTAIRAPVDVWQGADDTLVDVRAAQLLSAAVPGATRHELPGEGHFSLIIDHVAEYLAPFARASGARGRVAG